MSENEVVIEQPEENAAQEKPEMPQDGHRRPGPGMPPPLKDGQKGFRQPPEGFMKPADGEEPTAESIEGEDAKKKGPKKPPESDENGFRRLPEGSRKVPGRPPFGHPGERPADAPEEAPAEESVEE